MEGKGRRKIRPKQLLDDNKTNIRSLNLKEETIDRTIWRTRFGRNYGLVARQTTK
jgi:hypothetical protein